MMFSLHSTSWNTHAKVASLRALRSSRFCRGVAQLLLVLMFGQALPLVEFGHAYQRTLPAILKILSEGVSSWWNPLTVHAAPLLVPEPNPDAVDALWVGTTNSILKIDPLTGSAQFEIPSSRIVQALAVDDRRGVLWSYGEKTLSAHAFSGELLLELPVGAGGEDDDGDDDDDDDADGATADIVVNSTTGIVWLATGKLLHQFDGDGQLLATFALDKAILALAIDPFSSLVWVATEMAVRSLDQTGAVVAVLDLGEGAEVEDIDADPNSGSVWVALTNAIRRYDASGDLELNINRGETELVAIREGGGLWVATDKTLSALGPTGELLFEVDPFSAEPGEEDDDSDDSEDGDDDGSEPSIIALATDPNDLSAWVARQQGLSQIDPVGEIVQILDFSTGDDDDDDDDDIWSLALYTDIIAPEITILAPGDGSLIDTNTPEIQTQYSDIGIGVDAETLVLTANGQPLAPSCNFEVDGATCTLNSPLPEGEIILTAQIQDYVGNLSNSAQVIFTVDTIAPDLSITAPEQDANLSTSQPTIQFSYSDSVSGVDTDTLTLQLNGSELPVTCSSGTSTSSCVPDLALQDGPATVTATIQDQAGNTSAPAQVDLFVDTVAPSLTITAPDEGSLHNTGLPEIRLSYSDEGSGPDTSSLQLLANGNPLAVDCTADVTQATCTPVASFSDGPMTLSASISDLAGNPSETAQVSFSVDTAAPELSFTAPLEDSIFGTNTPSIALTYSDDGSGVDSSTLILTAIHLM